MTYDSSSQTLTASGVLNLSSTGSLLFLTMDGYNGNNSYISIMVTTKAVGLADTYQLQGSNDNSTWQSADNPFLVTQAMVTAGTSLRKWDRGLLDGFRYFRVNVTLDAGTTSTIVQTAYNLSPT